MEKQEAKSKWDELVRQLGAEVTPEIEQLVEAGPAPPVEPVSHSPRASWEEGASQTPAAPKRPAAGWDNLANEFGLPSPPEPEAATTEENDAPTKQVAVSRAIGADRPRRERPDQDRRDRHDKRRDSREDGREPSHRRRESPERRRKSSKPREQIEGREEETPAADVSRIEREASPPTRQMSEQPEPQAVEERPKPGPAVSLWHKIFGSPADQSAKLEEISTRPDDEPATHEAADERTSLRDTDTDRDRAVDDQAETRARDEFTRGEPDLESEQTEQVERRPRRPRRRRRGRGGKSESGFEGGHRPARSQQRSDELQQESDDLDDLTDGSDEIGFDDSQDASEADVTDTEDVEGDENGNQRSSRSRAALQRSIPSWDEAIGFIVDANMQSRSQRRPSGPSGSRSGSPRGRSRGRRRN